MASSASSGQAYWNVYDALVQQNDEYFVLKDFAPYMDAWSRLCALYGDQAAWQRKALINIAKSGYFSSDRTIRGIRARHLAHALY